MALPQPQADESHEAWMARCMGHPAAQSEFTSDTERQAHCNLRWEHRQQQNEPTHDHGPPVPVGAPTFVMPPFTPATGRSCKRVAEILAPDAKVPDRVLVFPAGVSRALWEDGDELYAIMDREAADDVIAYFATLGRDQVFDWEHQSEGGGYAREDGRAPAAGWIKGYEFVEGEGLFARVDWLKEAATAIQTREYRYFSPVFWVGENLKIFRIKSIALTNSPALTAIRPIAAKAAVAKDVNGDADMKAICKLLGLPETATEADILAAINARAAAPPSEDVAATVLAKSCGIAATNSKEFIAGVSSLRDKANVDPTKFVARADYDKLAANVTTLQQQSTDRDLADFVAEGMKVGKITANNRDLFETSFRHDAAKAREQLKNAPVIVAMGNITTAGEKETATEGVGREAVIAKAAREYDGDPVHRKFCTKREFFVADALRQAGHSDLTADEIKKVA